MIGLKRGTVKLLHYSNAWPSLFEKEKKLLQKKLSYLILDIQHIGSTAVPGMLAKPILDIDLGVKSTKDFKKSIKPLGSLGYKQVMNKNSPRSHLVFAKGPASKRTHYLHLIKYKGATWNQDLLFRDYLFTHKTRAEQYAGLKKKLAQRYPDNRKAYTKTKKGFILETIRIAKLLG